MRIDLSRGDGLPIYQKIVNQITYQVASGRLAPGAEMTPIRTLADQLVVNPNTVARAYRDLERAGILTTRRTAGTFVANDGTDAARLAALALLTGCIDALVVEARQMNVGVDELLDLVKRRYGGQPSAGEGKKR
jgi:GntR family transcriptional regulator